MINLDKKWVLFSLTWPIFIETSMRLLMGNISVFMISQYSDTAVAAVGISTQIVNMLIMIYGIVGTGTAIIISQHLGAGDKETASQAVLVSICANLTFGVLLSLLMLFFSGDLIRLMKLTGEAYHDAVLFLSIVGGLSFMQAIIATFGAVFRSYGYTKYPMVVALMMNGINIIGNYASLFQPFGLPFYGVKGVAVSMAVSAFFGMASITVLFLRNFDWRALIQSAKPFPIHTLNAIIKIGIPSATESVSYNFSQIMITYIITFMGTEVLATRIYALNITTFVYMLGLSIGQGTQILVGHMVGAGRNDQAYQMTLRNIKIALFTNFILSLALILFREPIFGLYTDNVKIITLGSSILLIDIFVEMGRALNHIYNGSLRGAGEVRYPMIINVLSMWGVGVTFCYLLGIELHWGLIGVWLAMGADEWIRGLALMLKWRSRLWERMILIQRNSKGKSA